ncbi:MULTISPECIES: 1,4-dihydroxy-2-naphthoate polyprenyltransferase [unclassified Lentimonas]|uniref:1,4-dihydroxy-2-naphthoate polyprenyltransferase n=1 Tax=unclassified Lentimonas TaxID=2630993 RepID=UPI001321D018|nr:MULTISPECIES: 1,4-dihydroxy-2-naphthoate polyprenyltransferase [unclassified Lentimonas]CAA6676729.1 1,4-dihydroxy-2-naphthoate polyprenyltransferase (EC [Lentimonas sp. CC4]CAA6684606.1 1,4-dihydroxy-2-naphthoate polyprenyltransferase (EC [Lentimonas sp. CC6]CAA7075242.1 1,4-dihydroxy-2-naphthoate polyprenyltransferase (EC [Lentimonas sp. CC4]CAA7170627.1 1,4-dihydroxy-2-naphthoate polyprenyltransferase (EC [Lentimonas sp. CC21]CAA7182350.1 1,4-dihydroxy-2-naphthoate polyprenyltransferase 
MTDLKIWLEATRPKTLPAAVVPVMLASSVAYADGCFDWRPALICVLFALFIQVGTNFANDYLDGIKGTDTEARLGPRRAVAAGLIAPARMKRATILVLAVGFCIGLALIPFGGWWLLAVGVASVACAWLYTGGPYPLAYNGLGDVFVVLFFGFVAVGCTYYVQAGTISRDVVLLGLGCGLLVNNILVVNNYRDLDEDRAARKRTLVVFFGRRFAQMQYYASALLAGVVVLSFWALGYGATVLIALLPVMYALVLGGRLSSAEGPSDFLEALKGSAKVVAAYGVLFSAGVVIGAVL